MEFYLTTSDYCNFIVTVVIGKTRIRLYDIRESLLASVLHTWLVCRLEYARTLNETHSVKMCVAAMRDIDSNLSYEIISRSDESNTET